MVPTSLTRCLRLNERNRKLNLLNIDRVKEEDQKSSEQRKLAEFDGGNSFPKKLKTRTKVFYQDLINQENEKAIDDAKIELRNVSG